MKSILVSTDFSLCSWEAVKMALAIARKSGSPIIFFHVLHEQLVVSHIPHFGHYDPIAEAEERLAITKLTELVSLANNSGLEATYLLKHGNVDLIADIVAEYQPGIIVIGYQRKSGLEAIIFGSFAQHVLNSSTIPVLVVQKCLDNPEIKNIVFASSFLNDMSRPLTEVITFGKLWNASINLLTVSLNDPDLDGDIDIPTMEQMIAKFPNVQFTTNSIGTNDEEWGIRQFAKLYPTDLIAISKKEFAGVLKIISENMGGLLLVV